MPARAVLFLRRAVQDIGQKGIRVDQASGANVRIQQDARRRLDTLFRNVQEGVQVQGIDR